MGQGSRSWYDDATPPDPTDVPTDVPMDAPAAPADEVSPAADRASTEVTRTVDLDAEPDDVWRAGDAYAIPHLSIDALEAAGESFTVTLKDPVNVTIGSQGSATVTIDSDDSAGAALAPNPIVTAPFFVRQHYRDFLGRDPEDAGLQFWEGQITQCGADERCADA